MSSPIPLDVVIPAGTVLEGAYLQAAGTPHRALAPIDKAGKLVLQIVIDSLRASQYVGRIIVVGDEALKQEIVKADLWIAAQKSGPANILAGLRQVSIDRPALVCTSDLPFISTESVDSFLKELDWDADVAVGVISAQSYRNRYPDAPPSEFVDLKDYGPATISGLFFVRTAMLDRNRALLDRAFSARKSQWQMAGLLGPLLVCQFAFKRLTMEAIIKRSRQILKCRVDVVRDAAPELAFDIDTVDDYNYARTHAG